MAYIHVKRVGNNKYYTLRVSLRKGNKVITKDLVNLGRDLSKIKIEDLEKKYHKEIRKSYSTIKKFLDTNYYVEKAGKLKIKKNPYLSKELMIEIEATKIHYNSKFLRLDELTKMEIHKNFLINFAFNTTSMEGNTITLAEAVRLLQENKTPKDKTLREIYDLQNTEKVFFDIINKNKKINHDFIIQIHDKLLENVDERKGYRTTDIRVFRAHFDATPGIYVRTDMNLLLEWYEKNKKRLHPLVMAALFHQKFEKIHPFAEGNGRTGRMLMNYILMKHGYPPFIVRKARRSEYLDALGEGDKSNIHDADSKYFKELIKFLAEELIDSYWNNFLV